MPEPHPRAKLNQIRVGRGSRRRDADSQVPGRPPHQHRIPSRIGRGQQQQPPGLRGQRVYASPEALFDPAR
jgi:hypothetical protein